ncbi:alpha-hydroxy-acid oxidizing protein [Arthrobacter sp. zg-Y826]|uniref:alpha-hydroxy-acid oxidizing protein n=1 Tax=Arthrobacter jinronghuae TaxID=2964609 RepID=UPI002102CB00|nr:alpha-hydroxy-acid oxidizing protein [Arthrobacter jinronghuae]MCQ1955901.1 alpha-hydroxy-acid oxidizing protein [Arthrobacter jinronghuae]
MSTNYGDYQLGIYMNGARGVLPDLPMSFAGMEELAEGRMDPRILGYVAGGAGNEHTQRVNVAAFERLGIMPRMLVGAAQRSLGIDLLGHRLPSPLFFAPVGVLGAVAGDGDLATAAASAELGIPMVASTLSSAPLEQVRAAAGETPGFFQLYPPADRELAENLVHRAEAAGYSGIVITLDTWVNGWRPRDLSAAYLPMLSGQCLANYLTDDRFRKLLADQGSPDPAAAVMLWASLFGNPTMTWEDLERFRSMTSLPIILKGICSPEDTRRALDGGMDGIYCSNHGGRQANGGIPAIDCLPGVVEAADGAPVLFDSGVRSGVDALRALALGATAVGIGRPYVYGLAAGGQAGITHVMRSLLAEADLTMAVNGYPDLASLRGSLHRL